MSFLDTDVIDNRAHDGLRVWHSADGKTFSGPNTIQASGLYSAYLPDVAATADRFTIFGVNKSSPTSTIAFSSVDGAEWTADDPGSLRGRLACLAQKADLTVRFTDPPSDDELRPTAWRRTVRDHDWIASHDVTVGSLPDVNVGKPSEQQIRQVTAWQDSFVATGSSGNGGGVWLSRDAARWERVPVKQNGFGDVANLSAFANDTILLVAGNTTSSGIGPLKIWSAP
ncbi:hypothetical protein [Amycolatopsis sp. DG1A-15b]|uniref:hypothetical protein n=1 Tax=Amycolatopsis sp. DG1A-15b TaxID=3052846 RepID=UPI00255BAD49|nr:hypothetical protein [Amycolatopsis sp. DG1A-15b]WIX92515.1 hypothetical protein QRY02_19580 [Amycolatopsis sp. DG1A-15b]